MLPAPVREALAEYRARLEAQFPGRVAGFRLFGSYARGAAHEESDVDVMVLIRDLTWEDRSAAVDAACAVALERDFEVDLSPLVWSPEEFQLRRDRELAIALDIVSEGIDL